MKITNFQGAMPRKPDKKLLINQAISCINCDTYDGQLKPILEPLEIEVIPKPGSIRSIFRIDNTWLGFTSDTDVVKSEGINTDNRIYYSGDGYPKSTDASLAISGGIPTLYPTFAYRLGVASPDEALTATTEKIVELDAYGDVYTTASYTYTLVSYINAKYSEESAPGPPTPPIDVKGNMKITLTNFVLPTGTGNNIIYYRVYRTTTSADETALFQLVPTGRDGTGAFIYDMPVSETEFIDLDIESEPQAIYQNLSEEIPSEGWDNLPDEAFGLTQYQNGILAAIYDQSVLISEAFIPYAFPRGVNNSRLNNSYEFEYLPVAIAAYRDMLIVGTAANPYVLTGSDPAYLSKTKLPFNQACLSSMCVTEIGVIYPSKDGLVVCDGITVAPMTTDTWTKEQWQALGPENLKMFYYKDKLIGFYVGTSTGFMYNFKTSKTVETLNLGEFIFYDGTIIEEESKLYLLLKDDTLYYVYEWEGSTTPYDQTWEGYFHTKDTSLFSMVRVDADFNSNDVVLTLTVDGVELSDITLSDDDPQLLPSGYRFEDLQYKFVSKATIDSIYIGNVAGELYDD